LNDFPHSKQNGLDRDVISPQNGHILEDPISPRDVFVAKSFPSESARRVRKVRRWTRKGCKTEPILSCSTGSRWHIRGSDSVQDCSTHTTALSPQAWQPIRSWGCAAKPKWAIQTSYCFGHGRSSC